MPRRSSLWASASISLVFPPGCVKNIEEIFTGDTEELGTCKGPAGRLADGPCSPGRGPEKGMGPHKHHLLPGMELPSFPWDGAVIPTLG